MKKFLSLILLLSLSIQLFACAETERAEDATVSAHGVSSSESAATQDEQPSLSELSDIAIESITEPADELTELSKSSLAAANFAVSLLQNTYEGKNCILSPYSVYAALAMAANGADALTLKQMEAVLGLPAAELNVYLQTLAKSSGSELQSANSVWYRQDDNFVPNAEFLQTNTEFFGADIFGADFSEQTLNDINGWVSKNTDGRIDKILEKIDPNAAMYLINALTFNAEWKNQYSEADISASIFHADDSDETVDMMHSEEHYYLDDGKAIGFMKPYKDNRYSFVALLPNGELDEYIAGLDGETLLSTVKNAFSGTVFAQMPSYELEYSAELSKPLSAMGMPDAFTYDADFSRMSNADLMISQVLHKTYLNVSPLGTQAGAATAVEMLCKGIAMDPKTVVLDRPFLMGIYDNINACFIFLGTVNSVNH